MPAIRARLVPAMLLLPAVFLAIGCNGDDAAVDAGAPARVLRASVTPNPNNVLSAVVTGNVSGAEKVLVELGTGAGFDGSTPEFPVTGESIRLPVLELAPETSYRMRVVAISSSGQRTAGPEMTFTTGALPGDLPKITVTGSGGTAPGYTIFGVTGMSASIGGFYVVAVDRAGRIVWYRKFDEGITDVQKQPNGYYTVNSLLGTGARHFYELDALGDVVREHNASDGLQTGSHELRLLPEGRIIFGLRDSVIDVTPLGGRPDARVSGMTIEYDRAGQAPLRWSTFDHMRVDDAVEGTPVMGETVNPWHLNAIDRDADGNLLVSFRNSCTIVKIDSRTGEVIWRLGGKRNQFTFVGDPLNGFTHQHGIRRLPNGNIILFDNGNLHSPQVSRAVEYRLDEGAKTAELVWEYRSDELGFGFALGFAQRLDNGNTLICNGIVQRLLEVDASKNIRWQLRLDDPAYFIYRAFRIPTLY